MKLGDKLRSLRAVEGSLRGLGRSMTQQELATAMKSEIGRGLSQAYLSQVENGARPHLTHTTRELLARFFRVYPGFLVDDPEGYTPGLQSELRAIEAKILRTPDLAERLGEVLHQGNHQNGEQKGSGHPPPSAALRN